MTKIPKSVSLYMAEKGREGGRARTEKKKRSGRQNVAKAREAKALKRLRPLEGSGEPRKAPTARPAVPLWDSAISVGQLRAGAKRK